jgi:hypothetical protein
MTAGDSSEWDGFIEGGGIAAVISLVVAAWAHVPSPSPDEEEKDTTIRLFSALVRNRDRQVHRFLIRYEDVEVDTDLAKETGRKDIVFFPGHDGNYYFCLEAKRLNARVNVVMKSLADEYVKEGMQRFVDGKYSRRVLHGGMIGYVLDGDIPRAMKNVLNNIRTHHASLRMEPPGGWEDSQLRPDDPSAKETHHDSRGESGRFRIDHLFVSGTV